MQDFVLDCSITMAWCISDEYFPQAAALLDQVPGSRLHVPQLWIFELGNALWQAERRQRISRWEADDKLNNMLSLPLVVEDVPAQGFLVEILALARRYNLTVYDATYLELALRKKLPLATRDAALIEAGNQAGVRVLAVTGKN